MLCAHCGKKIRAANQECIYLRWSKGRDPRLEEYGLHKACEMKYNTGGKCSQSTPGLAAKS